MKLISDSLLSESIWLDPEALPTIQPYINKYLSMMEQTKKGRKKIVFSGLVCTTPQTLVNMSVNK
jgi:hypothetical protein